MSGGADPRDVAGATPLPNRPRLAEHAAARRHVVNGVELVVVHDLRGGDLVELTAREWALVEHADGTRDVGGVELAAARAGVLRRASELHAVLAKLHAADLLAAGIEHPAPAPVPPRGRPLEPLAGATFRCDGTGYCCGFYGSISMTLDESRRALTLVREAPDVARRPTPETGSYAGDAFAAAVIEGRCAFLAEDGRCAIHAAAGEAAKPHACSMYPRTFVDDGESVRVSLALECPCAFTSGDDAPPILAPRFDGARLAVADDIGGDARVATIGELVAVCDGRTATRAELIAWSRAVLDAGPAGDAPSACWALAGAMRASGLDAAAARAALASPPEPAFAETARWFESLAARSRGRVKSAAWRSPRDIARGGATWLRDAAERLLEPIGLRLALDDASFAADELRYVRHAVHGHRLLEGAPLATGLRDRAVRTWLARALGPVLDEARDDPAFPGDATARHPLALVEGMMRGHGMRGYVAAVAGG